jgi:hypothetical protein
LPQGVGGRALSGRRPARIFAPSKAAARPEVPPIAEPPASVALVGNAPNARHPAARIDGADWVVRFNNAPGFGTWSGSRCTHLALVNHGGQMREWLAEPGFVERPAVRAAGTVLFPFPPKDEPVADEDGRDWTGEARAMLAPLGCAIAVIPPAIRTEARRILATAARPEPNPSTGFLVALHLLRTLPERTRVETYGFGFAGWPGHSWDEERRWFERMDAGGRLRLHPVEPTA